MWRTAYSAYVNDLILRADRSEKGRANRTLAVIFSYFVGELEEMRTILEAAVESYGEDQIGVTAHSDNMMELCLAMIQVGDLGGVNELYLKAAPMSPLCQATDLKSDLTPIRRVNQESWMKADGAAITELFAIIRSQQTARMPAKTHFKLISQSVSALLKSDPRRFFRKMGKAMEVDRNALFMVPFHRSKLHARMARAAKIFNVRSRESLGFVEDHLKAYFREVGCIYELRMLEGTSQDDA
ncbi:hypothetical protein HK101_007896 [Irineochytrium annulatum]|nr:hypothetical protein HK101_007896 [Irineochytrium annulatum]